LIIGLAVGCDRTSSIAVGDISQAIEAVVDVICLCDQIRACDV
jgi:hypothetical protein